MTTHTLHADVCEEGLAEGCIGCAELAARPFDAMDDDSLESLVGMVIANAPPRSDNEAMAMGKVADAMRYARVLHRHGWRPPSIEGEPRRHNTS